MPAAAAAKQAYNGVTASLRNSGRKISVHHQHVQQQQPSCHSMQPSGVLGENFVSSNDAEYHKRLLQEAHIEADSCHGKTIIFPWTNAYKTWWSMTAICALLTAVFCPYTIAYHELFWLEQVLTVVFLVDICVNFNLAIYRNELLVCERSKIVQTYASRMFWVDLIGVLPFDDFALALFIRHKQNTGDESYDDLQTVQLLSSLLRLLHLVRLHRLKPLSDVIQYNPRISLIWFTLLRNLAVFWFTTHFSACAMYFLARLHNFNDDTWLGPLMLDSENDWSKDAYSGYDRYVIALYWSVVTFVTVGYGDFAPRNSGTCV
jgi:Ion transport protein